MKSSTFSDIKRCSPLKINGAELFLLPASRWFLVTRRHIPDRFGSKTALCTVSEIYVPTILMTAPFSRALPFTSERSIPNIRSTNFKEWSPSSGVSSRSAKRQIPCFFLMEPRGSLKTKLHGLSPQANCTDRATAACRRS
jgi:hypothetical protein